MDAVGLAVLTEVGANAAVRETPIFQQEQMARAVEVGVGIQGPDEIAFVTDDAASAAYAGKLETILARG